jgi:hypothetical protein
MGAAITARYDGTVHLLSRVGLLALDCGLDKEADDIFGYVRRVLADPTVLDVSRAIVVLENGRPADAARILRAEVLTRDPMHVTANAILGLALRAAGLPGARACFETVLAISLDGESRNIASAGLASNLN